MNIVKTYKIGSVSLSQLESADIDSSKYSDDAESILYKVFKSENPQPKVKKLLSDNPDWPVYYHLSPYRKNVIDWYEFERGAKILEVGAGCGAITEALCQKDIKVTALELTQRRAEINAYRNKRRNNLEIVIGNLEDYQPKEKFDYVICVGVLEYAGTFINSEKPYEDFVKLLASNLSAKGKLIIAIENRLGLKYFSGSKEDHTGRVFDGINQYPGPKKIQTFGKMELKELVEKNDLKDTYFYYPYPDYKNPMIIYSDDYWPGKDAESPNKLPPVISHNHHGRNRLHLFSEQLSMISVEKNQIYRDIANSFIVIASKNGNAKSRVLYYTSTPSRKDKYRLSTYLKKDGGKFIFYKESASNESVKHLESIEKNSIKLKKIFNDTGINIVEPRRVAANKLAFDYIEGATLERLLFDSIVAQNYDETLNIIDRFIATIEILPGRDITNEYLIDLNFDNIIIDKNGVWNFIDYEWLVIKEVHKKIIVQRALIYFLSRYSQALKYLAKRGDYVCIAQDWYLPAVIYDKYSKYIMDLDELAESEKELQSMVNDSFSGHTIADKQLYETASKAELTPDPIEEALNNPQRFSQQEQRIQQLLNQEENLKNELELQRAKTRRAELTSPYYLTKKLIRRLKSYF
jgi:16S rRNA G527 N7-methylase RsmG